ncbi:MAG: TatD family hydrolase [Bacteroidales bacterium]|nr:TatD family hydrolase [Bacteroidales bacterium]
MELFDTHSHIYMPEFDADRNEVVKRAQAVGVAGIILPNVDLQTPPLLQALCDQYPDLCHSAMALHPTEVGPQYAEAVKQVERLLETNHYVAVGECGMDLYWDRTFRREQQWVLEQHLRWARDFRLPAIIHCREAFDDTIQLVEAAQDGSLTGVFHCFSGTAEQARRVINAGFAIGIGGVITYKKSDSGNVAQAVGLEHLLLETDAPYLAPVPFRGRRNESAYVALVAQKLAELLEISVEEVASVTTRHARRLFFREP